MAQVDIGTIRVGYDFSKNWGTSGSPGFEYLGNVYIFVIANGGNMPTGDSKCHCFKSTDGGATYNEIDAANAPFVGNTPGFANCYCVCHDGATAYIPFVRTSQIVPQPHVQIDGLTVQKFDLNTDTWSTSTNYATPTLGFMRAGDNTSRQIAIGLALRQPGDMVFYFSGPPEGNLARCFTAPFDGTTFGAAVEIPDQAGDLINFFFPQGVVCDSDLITHFFYNGNPEPSVPLGVPYFHVAMNPAGVFGVTEMASDKGYILGAAGYGTCSAPIFFTDSGHGYVAFFLLVTDDISNTTQSQRVYYAQTVGGIGPLTWLDSIVTQGVFGNGSPEILQTVSIDVLQAALTVQYKNGILGVVWIYTVSVFVPPLQFPDSSFYFSKADFATLVWDPLAVLIDPNPSAPWGVASQVSAFPMTNRIGVAAMSEGAQDANTDAEILQFNFINAPGATLSITCGSPPNGMVGIGYTHQLVVIGGVPPLSFAIIAGALPPGLSLDTSTGVISGVPTAGGGFTFTAQVTDSTPQSASVTCTIGIDVKRTDGGGGGWGCPVSHCLPHPVGTKAWGPVSISRSCGKYYGTYRDSLGQMWQFPIDSNLDAVNQVAAAVMRFERGQVDIRTNNPGRLYAGSNQIGEFGGVAVFASLPDGVEALKKVIVDLLLHSRREAL